MKRRWQNPEWRQHFSEMTAGKRKGISWGKHTPEAIEKIRNASLNMWASGNYQFILTNLRSPESQLKQEIAFQKAVAEGRLSHPKYGPVSLRGLTDYEVGYLVGVYYGDGSSTSGNHPLFRVNGGLSIQMLNRFGALLDKIAVKHRIYNDGRYYRLYVTSWSQGASLAENLESAFETIKNGLLTESAIGFLCGIYDSEGHFRNKPHSTCPNSIQYQIEIAMTAEEVMRLISRILTGLGFQHSFVRREPRNSRCQPIFRIGVYSKRRIASLLIIMNPAIDYKRMM